MLVQFNQLYKYFIAQNLASNLFDKNGSIASSIANKEDIKEMKTDGEESVNEVKFPVSTDHNDQGMF